MTTAEPTGAAAARLGLVGLLALSCVLGVRLVAGPAMTSADARLGDRVMACRNGLANIPPVDDTVVHIDLDDRSARMWMAAEARRPEFAAVMRTIASAGVAAQVYDFVFAGSTAAGDEALAAAAGDSSGVYAGMVFGFPGRSVRQPNGDSERDVARQPWSIAPVSGDALVPSAVSALWPYDSLRRAVAGTGFLNVEPDADGVFRRVPLVAKYQGRYYPSLALRAACGYLDVSPDRVVVEPGRAVTLRDARFPDGRRDVVIPTDRSGALQLDFRRDWGAFRHYSMGEVWRDSMDPTAAASWRAALEGRIAIVAEVATMRGDMGPTPIDGRFPLAGLHSTAIANILEGRFLRAAPRWVEPGVTALALAAVWLLATWAPRWLWVGGIVVVVTVLGGAAAVQVAASVLVPVTFAATTTVVFVLAAGTWRFIDAAREKEITRRAFEAYFPPAVVARLVADRGRLLNGARKELTVVFSDIVGFTSRSATMPPEDVQSFLNEYFTSMVEVVFEHGGTVDKFIGDGLMVFFNDPDDQPDHAVRGVRCALAMQAKVAAMKLGVHVRVGVHTGPAIVGNMGSVRRLSYTAVGSNVNLAQRLESAAPPGGVLISGETARRLPAGMSVRDVGEIHVKGFESAIHVFVALPPTVEGVAV